MTQKELAKMVRFARKQGLKSLKFNGVEFEFSSPQAPKPRAGKSPLPKGEAISNDIRMPTEDELLMWSTETFDLMRADREAATKEKN